MTFSLLPACVATSATPGRVGSSRACACVIDPVASMASIVSRIGASRRFLVPARYLP
jgi:hypothetical protein